MSGLHIGEFLAAESGGFYMVIGWGGHYFELVRVPDGMTANDYGRRFRHAPIPEDHARAVLMSQGDQP